MVTGSIISLFLWEEGQQLNRSKTHVFRALWTGCNTKQEVKTEGLMLEMLSMLVMCWASAPMPTLPLSCVFHCVAISSETVSVSDPHGHQTHRKCCKRGEGIQGED